MARWWRRKATFSVLGLVTDDGSTFVPAARLHGDVRALLADEDRPLAGSVLYVIRDAPDVDQATNRAVEHFEARAAHESEVWEQGEVYFL